MNELNELPFWPVTVSAGMKRDVMQCNRSRRHCYAITDIPITGGDFFPKRID